MTPGRLQRQCAAPSRLELWQAAFLPQWGVAAHLPGRCADELLFAITQRDGKYHVGPGQARCVRACVCCLCEYVYASACVCPCKCICPA